MAQTRLPADYPPTPPLRLPLLGHMHYIVPYVLNTGLAGLEDLNRKYGKNGVLCLHFGPFKLVLLGEKE